MQALVHAAGERMNTTMDNNAIKIELTQELATMLKDLVQLDIDASLAYQQAIDGCEPDHVDVKADLTAFRDDHERHIEELSKALISYGVEPPKYRRDLKGFLIEGMTAIRSAMGTKQALKAMRQNELLTNMRYQAGTEMGGLPADVEAIVARGREDERRHLAAIEDMVAAFERADDVRA
jgi:hypothetical protein